MAFCPEHPKRDQNLKFTPPKRDDEHPRPFHVGVPPPPGFQGKILFSLSPKEIENNAYAIFFVVGAGAGIGGQTGCILEEVEVADGPWRKTCAIFIRKWEYLPIKEHCSIPMFLIEWEFSRWDMILHINILQQQQISWKLREAFGTYQDPFISEACCSSATVWWGCKLVP